MDYSGLQFGQYQIIERLGQGGMATVYKAYDTRLERYVAIKIVRKESIPPEQLERTLKRFEREAKALAKFLHPNIVPVYDYGDHNGAPYLVMAYLPGGTLKEHIGRPIDPKIALAWASTIADALNYAHQQGVVHRDVKPSNILITDDGNLMLSDFGIAQVLEQATTQLTVTGMGVGTPEYMAPEQWQGNATAASDQYALGVVLYELLTGVKPYSAETPLAVALKVMGDPLPHPSNLVPGIPEKVEKLLYKLLARSPQDRYEDMNALSQALKGFAEQGTPTTSSDDLSISQVPVLFTQPLKQERFSELEYLETIDSQQSDWDTEDEDATRDEFHDKITPRSHLRHLDFNQTQSDKLTPAENKYLNNADGSKINKNGSNKQEPKTDQDCQGKPDNGKPKRFVKTSIREHIKLFGFPVVSTIICALTAFFVYEAFDYYLVDISILLIFTISFFFFGYSVESTLGHLRYLVIIVFSDAAVFFVFTERDIYRYLSLMKKYPDILLDHLFHSVLGAFLPLFLQNLYLPIFPFGYFRISKKLSTKIIFVILYIILLILLFIARLDNFAIISFFSGVILSLIFGWLLNKKSTSK